MTKQVDVKKRILEENEKAAARLRQSFRETGTLVVNLISSPGSGKTTLLEATAAALASRHRLGVLVGDIATERDADRLRKAGLPARQILTGGSCHLDARQIDGAFAAWGSPPLEILVIENVGNLICPTSFDLGEDFKVALLSVTEGDDKPFKYPGIFSRAAVTLITKTDLLPHVPFDMAAACGEIRSLNPGATVLELSARSGEGMDRWIALLEDRLAAKTTAMAAVR
jgi:hydrogenase nickel incorporation protein HypB